METSGTRLAQKVDRRTKEAIAAVEMLSTDNVYLIAMRRQQLESHSFSHSFNISVV